MGMDRSPRRQPAVLLSRCRGCSTARCCSSAARAASARPPARRRWRWRRAAPAARCCWSRPIRRTPPPTSSSGRSAPIRPSCCPISGVSRSTPPPNRRATCIEVKDRVRALFGHSILKEAYKQIDLAASMPGAEEVALFDRMGGLIRGDDTRFNLVVFDTAPTGHTLRLVRMPELMDAWIRALTRSRRAMLGVEGDDKEDPILVSLRDRFERLQGLRARLMSGRTMRLRARAHSRAPADRGDRARPHAARRHRRQGRRPGREPRAAARDHRRLPAGSAAPRNRSTSTRSPRALPTVRASTCRSSPAMSTDWRASARWPTHSPSPQECPDDD